MLLAPLENRSPYQVLFGTNPKYDHLRDPATQPEYCVFDLETHIIYTSRDIQFFEVVLAYKDKGLNGSYGSFTLHDHADPPLGDGFPTQIIDDDDPLLPPQTLPPELTSSSPIPDPATIPSSSTSATPSVLLLLLRP
ncbi:unnamed protein product [Linum trigynum]|uniref:Uncharacterized protein n=1 Tax=Linum trigynum TaxID=586398 RepID=A0AAV2ERI1_9ROSI